MCARERVPERVPGVAALHLLNYMRFEESDAVCKMKYPVFIMASFQRVFYKTIFSFDNFLYQKSLNVCDLFFLLKSFDWLKL